MRPIFIACVLFGAACSTDSEVRPAFSVQSDTVTIMPGEEITKCFYFHTPNSQPLAINKWVSNMTPGSHHMIFFTGGLEHADGIDDNVCGLNLTNGIAGLQSWVFAAQTPHSELLLPANDGTGKPIAQLLQPNMQAAFQMHYLNSSDKPLEASVKLEAYALSEGSEYTLTAPYITYNFDISIPPQAKGVTSTASCDAPPGKFWQITTHAHKQAVATEVKDGNSMMFQSTDWEHPGRAVWDTSPFYPVESGKVTWTCTYDNIGDNANRTVVQGPSAQTNEMCMAVGSYFPAQGARVCRVKNGDCACIDLP